MFIIVSLLLLLLRQVDSAAKKYNVIHIVADDLRPELGCYGLTERHTPNIDKLAENGTVSARPYNNERYRIV